MDRQPELSMRAQEVVAALRSACADLTADAHRVHRSMDAARVELAAAFSARQAARRCVNVQPWSGLMFWHLRHAATQLTRRRG